MGTLERLGNFARNGLAIYGGIVLLSSALSFLGKSSSTRLDVQGKLEDGLSYSLKTDSHYTPGNSFAEKYVIRFNDGVVIEDAFKDGFIGPGEIIDTRGKRLITKEKVNEGWVGYVDDEYREAILKRVQEVFSQNGIEKKVQEMK